MQPAEFLVLVQDPAASDVNNPRLYRALQEGAAESFLTLHTRAGRFESASYSQLTFISGDDRGGGTSIRLLFAKMVVTLRGRQLGAVFEAIRQRKAAHVYEFDGGRYDPPEPGQPIVTDITFAREQPAETSPKATVTTNTPTPREEPTAATTIPPVVDRAEEKPPSVRSPPSGSAAVQGTGMQAMLCLYPTTRSSAVGRLHPACAAGAMAPLPAGLLLGRETTKSTAPRIGFVTHEPARVSDSAARWVTYGGDGHLITFGASGEGKTTGPLICNALTWAGQLVCVDIKGEVHAATAAARRALGQRVYTIDMREEMPSDSLNPIALAKLGGTDMAVTARSLAATLVGRTGHERENFWNDWAESLITACLLWASEADGSQRRGISAIYDLLSTDDFVYSIAAMVDRKEVCHRSALAIFNSFLAIGERETRRACLPAPSPPLRLFDSDLVRRLTDTTSIPLADFVAGVPMSIYLIVTPAQLAAYRPLLRLWLSGLMTALTQRTEIPACKTLLLIDEAGNLGRMESLLTAYTLLRGYGMTVWSFFQSLSQLNLYQDQAPTILDNAGTIQLLGARHRRQAEEFAALVGGIDADTILAMPRDEQLLLMDGGTLTRCRRIRYFAEPELARLYKDPWSPVRR